MEMLSSATKMDIFPTFLQSEKDFDEDFNYITSSGTTLGEMLSTENFLESYGYDSKSPDDIFGDDDDTNDFVAIIKQEPGFEYHDYQVNTSPESEMSSFEDQLQLVNTSNDLMSVDLEYLMNMQKVPAVKQEHENVVIKVEAIDSGVFTDESVPVFSHEVSAELSTNKGLQYLFEGGIVKAEKEFDWKAGFEDIDCVVPSLFMDASSGHPGGQVATKSDPMIKSEITIKREATDMSKSPNSSESFANASSEELNVDEIVRRNETDSSSRIKNSESKRSAPEIVGKSNKKLKKLGDSEDGDERLKKAVNNVKLRQQKKFEERRLREQKRRDEEFEKKARERAQYFSRQIASGALQVKPAKAKEEKKTEQKMGRGRKSKASPERSAGVNFSSEATSASAASSIGRVNSLNDLCPKGVSKRSAAQLATQSSSASLVSSTSQPLKSVDSSLSKRSSKVNAVLLSSSVTSTSCQMKTTSTTSVKRSPNSSSLPSDSSASGQVKSLSIFPSKASPAVNDVVLASSISFPVTSASCLMVKADRSIRSSGSVVQSASAASVPSKVNTSCVKISSILSTSNTKPQLPLAVSVAKGGISILKSPAARAASSAVANSASKTLNAVSADTQVTYAARTQATLLKPAHMPVIAGTSVLRAPPPTQLQKFGTFSPAMAQNSRMVTLPGQKPSTGTNKMPVVVSGNASPSGLVESETITRSAECQLVANDEVSGISEHELESKPVNVEAELIDDTNECDQALTTGTDLLTESPQEDGNNNVKQKEKKKRLNLSEYMNRLKERSRNETSETKPHVTNESLESCEMKPCVTNENPDSNYSVLTEHNYCIRPKEPSNDLRSGGDNSFGSDLLTSGKMISSTSDGSVFHLKALVTSPVSVTPASPDHFTSKGQSVDEQSSSSVTTTKDYGSLQPKNPVTHKSPSSPEVEVNGKISSNCVSSQPGIAFKHNQDVTSGLHSTVSSSSMVNCVSDHVKTLKNNQVAPCGVPKQVSGGGKVTCASSSTFGRQWKLIPHNLQVTLVSFRNAIGQKMVRSNDDRPPELENVNLNQVECPPPHVPSEIPNAGNIHESSQPSKAIGRSQVASQEEFFSHQPFSDAGSSESTVSTSYESLNESCRVSDSVAISLPNDQLLFSSSCALTSVSAEDNRPANLCASSPAPSTSFSVDREKVHTTRTSRNWRRVQSSRSSRSSSSDSCRSRSPIRPHRHSRDESSPSSYSSRSPSRQRSNRDYRRNNRYDWYEKKWRSDNFNLDDKDKIREKKIYVGGIPDDCTPLDLKERFKHFGEIIKVSVHPQTEQENYGFLTFRHTKDALRVKEEGHKVAGCESFHFCYGDRRSFCKEDYKDFDNMRNQSWDDDVGYRVKPKQSEDTAFEDMLKAHLRDPRRKNH